MRSRTIRWVIVAWTALWAAIAVIGVVGVLTKDCSDILDAAFSGDSRCANILVHGKGRAAALAADGPIVIWLIGLAVLGVVWAVTRERKRTCPHCGNAVAKGLTACANCGYDFTLGRNPAQPAAATPMVASPAPAAAAPAPVDAAPPPAWYDDAERPGHKRWWDGTAWGVKDDEPPPVGWAGQEP